MKSKTLVLLTLVTLALLVASCDVTKEMDDEIVSGDFDVAEANLGTWTWIDVPSTICRDGSSTGIGVRLQEGASDLQIFIQGGGACYDAQSCEDNANAGLAGSSYSEANFQGWVSTLGNNGMFDQSRPENPVMAWNQVYIPYCSSDLHGGNRSDVTIADVAGLQQFRGHQNMQAFIDLLAPYFQGMQEVLVSGSSAGGYGVALNYPKWAAAFPGKNMPMLVDAAPIFDDPILMEACFQEKLRSIFDLQLPSGCENCDDPNNGGLSNVFKSLSIAYPNSSFAYASADADLAGILFLGTQNVICGGENLDIFKYRRGLLAMKSNLLAPSNWSTFYWAGLQHTAIQFDNMFYDKKTEDKTVAEWLEEVMAGTTTHVAAP